jgi:hypothetical protein
MHIDARCIHVLEAARNIEAAGRERPVDGAGHVEGGVIRIVRRDGHLDARSGQQTGGFLGQNVGVGVDGSRRGHFVP